MRCAFRLTKDTQLVNFVMHIFDRFCNFYISLFIVNHLQLNLEQFQYLWSMAERNVKIVSDPRKSLN